MAHATLSFPSPPMVPFSVIYEDNHLLVVNKPPDIATMGVTGDRTSVLDLAKDYLKRKYNKPGNVYLGVVSRLDAPVTGVLLFARTSKAASRLSEQFRRGSVRKRYWTVVEGVPEPWEGSCHDWICKDERHRKVFITRRPDQRAQATPAVSQGSPAQEAHLSYRGLQRLPGTCSLLEVELGTGRKHQIRVQLSHRGWPIYGDRKYGAQRRLARGIALHAKLLEIEHPVKKDRLTLTAPLPELWGKFGIISSETLK